MIKITAELWPGGDPKQRKTLGLCIIANDGTGDTNKGNYVFSLTGKRGRELSNGKVQTFPRRRKDVWALLALVLKEVGHE